MRKLILFLLAALFAVSTASINSSSASASDGRDSISMQSIFCIGNWQVGYMGFVNEPTNAVGTYTLNGNICSPTLTATAGTSNSSSLKVTLPFVPKVTMNALATLIYNSAAACNTCTGRIDLTAGSNIAIVYRDQTGLGWSTSGQKNVRLNFSYPIDWQITSTTFIQRKVFFVGNSLSNLSGGNVYGGKRFPQTCYQNLIDSGCVRNPFNCNAISGKSTTQLIADFPTQVKPYLRQGDVVFLWELTVDIKSGVTPEQAYQNYITYAKLVHDCGARIVVGTMIARDATGDGTAIETSRLAVNAYIMADTTYFDGKADFGAMTQFDSQSDCTSGNYNTDKLHLSDAGYDLCAPVAAVPILYWLRKP